MKKTLIATAVAASVLPPISAHAINFAADGTGEVLLYPYYNVNQGNATFIGVANTTQFTKVLKVRFRESVESEDVLDFQLWLSPYDHWTAVMSQVGGQVRINTSDTSCTVPSLASGAALLTNRISDLYTGNVLDRMSEGHIEILEMAEVDPVSPTPSENLSYAITHINGVPPNCDGLTGFNAVNTVMLTQGGVLSGNNLTGSFWAPGGGLYGIAAVFNPTDGTYFTYSAEALQNFANTPIWFAQRSVEAGVLDILTADDVAITEHRTKLFDLPDLSTPDGIEINTTTTIVSYVYGGVNSGTCQGGAATCIKEANYLNAGGIADRPADAKRNAVTAALQSQAVTNDFLTGALYDTDWVFTFPGKYMFREAPNAAGGYAFDDDGPFTVSVSRPTGQACENVNVQGDVGIRDREERKTAQDDVDFSPGDTSPFLLCYEVNVVSINDDGSSGYSSALASGAVWQQGSGWPTYGFAQLEFTQSMVDDNGVFHYGLPFMGFAGITDRSSDVTRGGTFQHKVVRGLD